MDCVCLFDKRCRHVQGTKPKAFEKGSFERIAFCRLYPEGIPDVISEGKQECEGNKFRIATDTPVNDQENKPYEKLLDRLNYDLDRALDGYREGDQRIPSLAASGLLFAKAIELYFELRGIDIDDISRVINTLNLD